MKILVVSRPRCRTTFLCESASIFYNVTNFHEDYDYIMQKYRIDYQRYFLLRKTPELQELSHNLCSHVKSISEKVEKQNGIIKLFPRYLLSYFFTNVGSHMCIEDFTNFKYTCETNVSEIFKLNTYDQIIFLERNLVDSAISYAHGIQTKKMLFTDQNLVNYELKKQQKVYIDDQVLCNLNFFIFEYYLYFQLKSFILQNYKGITLNYDTCIDYVKNNYNIQTRIKYVDTNFDYSNKIENYAKVKSYVLETADKYATMVPNFTFR